MRLSHVSVFLLIFLALPARPETLETIVLEFATKLTLEVADTIAVRTKGLSERAEVPAGTGMIFLRDDRKLQQFCFWMKDTLVPLDVAFIASTGRVVAISSMEPHSEEDHCAPTPVTWAVEAPAGWFADNGVAVGRSVGRENLTILRKL